MLGSLAIFLKYIFVMAIYLFIYGIMRLVYLDIKSMNALGESENAPYIKLINRRESLGFKVQENYVICGSVFIGRSKKNNICIQDPYLSSVHARIFQKDGKYFLEDMDSTNGTFVNGRRIRNEQLPLNDGDKIHMGQLDFIFVSGV